MTFTALVRVTALTTILAAGAIFSASAQTSTAPMPGQGVQPGTMGHGSMLGGMCEMMMSHMRGRMNEGTMGGGLRMRVLFALADTNGDGALSFEEVTAIHKRIFDAADLDKDGKLTRDELQKFFVGP
jgi:EF hand domain-containing protein